MSTVACQTNN